MLATVEDVKELTGYDVTQVTIAQAQGIIEVFSGVNEFEIVSSHDAELMAKAVAYQAAYMSVDPVRIFEQMSVAQLSQFGANVSFKQGDTWSPFVAPMAAMACERLSWKRMRSVRVGSIFNRRYDEVGWDRA